MKYKNLPVSFRGNYKMWNELNDIGGWRGLFDCLASEWWSKCCAAEYELHQGHLPKKAIEEKWEMIHKIKEFCECTLDELISLYLKHCKCKYRNYRIAAIPLSIFHYAEHYEEARQILKSRAKTEPDLWADYAAKWSKINRQIDEPFESSMMQSSKCF